MAKTTQQQLADLTGLSQPRISQLLRQGVIAREDEINAANRKIIKHLGDVAAGHQAADGVDRILEAALLDRTKREEIEIRIQEKRGSLIPDELLIDGLADTFAAVKAKLLALPTKLRATRPNLSLDDVGAIETHIRETLSELSDDRFPRSIRERLAKGRSRVSPRAKKNRQ